MCFTRDPGVRVGSTFTLCSSDPQTKISSRCSSAKMLPASYITTHWSSSCSSDRKQNPKRWLHYRSWENCHMVPCHMWYLLIDVFQCLPALLRYNGQITIAYIWDVQCNNLIYAYFIDGCHVKWISIWSSDIVAFFFFYFLFWCGKNQRSALLANVKYIIQHY